MTTAALSLFYLVIVLGILVYVHELGHFVAAKAFKVRVEVFSLGFGPRLFGVRRRGTDYRVSAIPLGGYVRMAGELGAAVEGERPADPGFLIAKPRWQRLTIMLAGPAMNVGLALTLWWALFVRGVAAPDIPVGPPVIERCEAGAADAGLLPGDRILAIGGRDIGASEDYEAAVIFRPGQAVVYRIERGGRVFERTVVLGTHPQYGTGWDGVRIRMPILIQQVAPGGPAALAGVQPGDRLLEINGHVPGGLDAVARLVSSSKGVVALKVLRSGAELELAVTPAPSSGGRRAIGVGLTYPYKFVQYNPGPAAVASLRLAWSSGGLLFRTISALVRRQVGLGVMSGPLEIARISREQAELGLVPFLQLLAFISLQLGVFNLLPVPVLDGGHILILLVESALRRDVSLRIKERVLQVGFVLLVAFAVAVLAMDVRKWLGRGAAAASHAPQTERSAPAPP